MSLRPFRRLLPALAPFFLLACSRTNAAPHAAAADPAAAVTRLADEYFAGLLERTPELATFWGLKDARHDGVFDASPEAFARWRDREDAWFSRVSAIAPAGLAGKPAEVTLAILRESLESAWVTPAPARRRSPGGEPSPGLSIRTSRICAKE
jgi:uncharacterized protein (DUF885 family)